MAEMRTLLLIDNNSVHAEVFQETVLNANDGPFQAEWVKTLSQGMERLREKTIWAMFVNLSLPDSQGLNTLDKLQQAAPGIPILVLSGIDDDDIALEALRRGAKDY